MGTADHGQRADRANHDEAHQPGGMPSRPDDADDCAQGGEEEGHSDEQRLLVVSAEGRDGEVFQPRRRAVDEHASYRDHR
jgi:hypothetical protein